MASAQREQLEISLTSGKAGSPGSRDLQASTPVSRNGGSPLADDAIWKRLREAGFDEESVKRRDKAALIAYIAKLEVERFDYQHHMGLLILERKEWASKYEQVKASADLAEITYKCDQAARATALAEAKKREECLKKALGVEKECIANIEKTLHEMRVESAATKIAAEEKMAEARNMAEQAEKKYAEAEAKLYAAESLQAEASRYHRSAESKLQEVLAREDELRRRLVSFKFDSDAKEKEISLERQSLCERQRVLQQGQERLLDGQALLNQREEYIFGRSQELSRLEKELEASKEEIENGCRALNEEKSNLDLNMAALSKREEAVVERETQLSKKEQELLIVQEKLANKEYDEIQRLKVEHEAALEKRKSEFEAELEIKRKLMEDEMETKRRAFELKEVDLNHKEELVCEREHDLEVQSRALVEKDRDATERLKSLEEKEKSLNAFEKEVGLEKINLKKEREEINNMKLDLQKSMDFLENKRKQVEQAQENLEAMKSEREELLVLEMKLKEEIDSLRAQKLQLMAEAGELKEEKAKFETEWELIDEKREELRKEAERVSEERKAVSKFLKEERDSLKLEKDLLQDRFKHDVESLSCEREAFISKMEHEHSEWFSKIQQERADLLLYIEMQKNELESCIDKRREEIEIYLREREEAFEQEKAKELRNISSLKETVAKELEHVALEMNRLDNERIEINLDRERREKEWDEIKNSIEELQIQREKLTKQRELLHADREAIHIQIQHLKKLEDVKVASEKFALSEMRQGDLKSSRRRFPAKKCLNPQTTVHDVLLESHPPKMAAHGGCGLESPSKQGPDSASPSSSTPFSWIKRCADLIFKHPPEKIAITNGERSLISDFEDAKLKFPENKYSQNVKKVVSAQMQNVNRQRSEENDITDKILDGTEPMPSVLEEPKVILEVPAVEDVRGSHNLESERDTDAAEHCIHSFSERGLLAGRKRHKNASSYDHVDAQIEQRQNNKKRRQRKDATETLREEMVTNCVVSTQPTSTGDENDQTSFHQTPRDAEENSGYVDNNHKIPEVSTENNDTDNSAEQIKGFCLQNHILALDQDNLQGGEPEGHAKSSRLGNGVSCGLKGQKAIQKEILLKANETQASQNSQNTGIAD